MNVIEAYLPEDHDDDNLPEFKSNELKSKLDENVKTAEERMNNLYDQFAKREAELNAKSTELEKDEKANDTKEDNDRSGDDDTSDKEDANEEQSAESDNDSEENEEEVQSLESADESDEEPQCLESDDISVGDKEEDVVVLISDQSDTEGEHSSAANGYDPKEDLD